MPAAGAHTLPRSERLRGRTSITAMMRSGKYVSMSPLRLCYHAREDDDPSRIVVSVPKRLFKRAVKRNLLKRRIRESYRLQKHLLPTGYDLLWIYTSSEVQPFAPIFEATGRLLTMLAGDGKVQ